MSVAIAHFAIGATISLIIFRSIAKPENYIQYDIIVAVFGGFWAMIPDMPELFNMFGHVFEGILCNVFFFHCVLDQLDVLDSPTLPVIIMLISVVILLIITPRMNIDSSQA